MTYSHPRADCPVACTPVSAQGPTLGNLRPSDPHWYRCGNFIIWYTPSPLDTCGSYSEVYAFADDAKFFRHILTDDDRNDLQCAVDALQNWSRKWLLNLNETC